MVAVRTTVIMAVATAGTIVSAIGHPLDAIVNLAARHDEPVTVTVTATTCPEHGTAPPPAYSVSIPVVTPPTSVATPTVPIVSTVPTGPGSSGTPPSYSISIGSVNIPPVVKTTTPAVVTSVPISVPTTETPTISTTDVDHSTVSSGIESSTAVTTSAVIATPPAVGNAAGKMTVNDGALALLAFAFLI